MAFVYVRTGLAPVVLDVLWPALAQSAGAVQSWGIGTLDPLGPDVQTWADEINSAPQRRVVIDAEAMNERGMRAGQIIEGTFVALTTGTGAAAFLAGRTPEELVDGGHASLAAIVEDGQILRLVAATDDDAAQLASRVDEVLHDMSSKVRRPPEPQLQTRSPDANGPFEEFEVVRLREDIPDEGLATGDVGAVVMTFADPEAYAVEFVNEDGSTRALRTFDPDQLERVQAGEQPAR